ncbi:MAG: MotA/TolQ/ExbB proton channel family protein [Gammaproteobacteria bacterium]|nr:MotA/TolQ/ExbB proton channel family protein [Gammaproteobacteria bacterium]
MLELIRSGGWLMVPIGLCSVGALGICLERLWSLRLGRAAPPPLLGEVKRALEDGAEMGAFEHLCAGSPLGAIFLAGIARARHGRDAMKEAMEEAAASVVHDMERYLTALGTIAAISPLLGLLGTVMGMIEVFRALVEDGIGNPEIFASGISEALVTSAAGLVVAIPALIMHRYLLRKVDDRVVVMERCSSQLVEFVLAAAPPPGERR